MRHGYHMAAGRPLTWALHAYMLSAALAPRCKRCIMCHPGAGPRSPTRCRIQITNQVQDPDDGHRCRIQITTRVQDQDHHPGAGSRSPTRCRIRITNQLQDPDHHPVVQRVAQPCSAYQHPPPPPPPAHPSGTAHHISGPRPAAHPCSGPAP